MAARYQPNGLRVIDPELIAQVVATIVDRVHPHRIVLFGSHARGDAGPDSDLDLMIEMDTPLRPVERAVAIGRLFLDRDWPFDVVVYTPEEVERDRRRFGSLLTLIEAGAKTLYDDVGVRS